MNLCNVKSKLEIHRIWVGFGLGKSMSLVGESGLVWPDVRYDEDEGFTTASPDDISSSIRSDFNWRSFRDGSLRLVIDG